MCEIIDESCHQKFFHHLRTQSDYPGRSNKQLQLQFDPSLLSFKRYRKQAQDRQKFQALVQIRQKQKNLDIYLQIELSKGQFNLSARTIRSHRFEPIISKQIRKLQIKQISKRTCLALLEPYQIVINMDSGDYRIKTVMQSAQMSQSELNRKLINLTDGLVKKLNQALALMAKIQTFDKQQISQPKKQKIYQLLKYYARSTTYPSFTLKSECAEYRSLTNRYAVSRCDLQSLDQYHNDTFKWSQQGLKSLSLYGFNIQNDKKSDYLVDLSLREKQAIQEEIGIPSFATSKPLQNKYIFNHCYFYNTIYPQKKIALGGNCQLFVLKPEIYEFNSISFEADNVIYRHENPAKYITKHLIYKKKFNENVLTNNSQQSQLAHESQIVTYFRGGSCLFLPKYYLNVDQETPYYKELFMDYLPGDTLDQFFTFNFYTISIYTKIYLIMQVLQALRFVNNYGIVHLDVKETNIILLKRMICKLIDFGQSYHYKLCGNKHKPKYTHLYASPEVVTSLNGKAFTEKSDVFSFGIMVHKILFNRYPYFFTNQKSFEKGNFDKLLREKTFYLPEQIEEYGHKDLIGLIYQLILRCIEMQQQKRPYLDWVTLIMKSCFSIFTSQ